MKFNKILLTVFSLFLIITLCNHPSYSQQENADNTYYDDFEYGKYETIITEQYNKVEKSQWNRYFKKCSKKFIKNWKYNKELFKNNNYKTSYARVMLIVDKEGQILSYKIKSSCIPYKDTDFLEKIEYSIKTVNKLAPLPENYKYDFIEFTIKFHTKLPDSINSKNIDWERYGVADIEIDNRNKNIFLKSRL